MASSFGYPVAALPQADAAVVRLVQISDCHLFGDAGQRLLGLDTRASLERVVQQIQCREMHRGLDAILATGDISQDGTPASYQTFLRLLDPLPVPCAWIQGNHDLVAPMQQAAHTLPEPTLLDHTVVEIGASWRIVLLNSAIEHQIGGALVAEQLDFLRQVLSATDRYMLIALHHPPCLVGSQWLDQQMISNFPAFWSLLQGQPKVCGIICGHVHHEFHAMIHGVPVWSVPSTCVQFLPGSRGFALDTLGPGYRWLELYPEGRIKTAVERVLPLPGLHLSSAGY